MPPRHDFPMLRADLIITAPADVNGGACVIKDPITGRFFRFKGPERFIAQHLDGTTPLDVIRRRTEEEFQSPLSSDELDRFVAMLRRLGLIESAIRPSSPQRPIRGNLLYLRLKALDPDRFLSRLVPRIQWLFAPTASFVTASLIAVAFTISLANSAGIAQGIPGLIRLDALVLIWATLVAITVVHEFAHGVACKRFGGSVHEMGFLLLYFQPAMYCNVSDAWLFPEKRKRLWVTFAGAYVELFFWALATLAWRMTEPGTGPNNLALVVMATLGIKILFNLNPLIKLDGYYLLSDFLEMPNLRYRAFQYLRSMLGLSGGSGSRPTPRPTPRERRVYLVYAILAGAFSLCLLGLIASYAARFLIGRYQGFGFLAFTGMMVIVFLRPLRAMGSRIAAGAKTLRNARGRMSRPQKITGLLSIAVIGLSLLPFDLRVPGDFTILPAHNADVRAEVEGTIERIFVHEGDLVAKGAPLARLSDRAYRAELEKTRLEISESSAKRNMLTRGATREEIELVRATVAKAKEHSRYSQQQLQRLERLTKDQLTSQRELEQVREEAAVRDQELKEAEGSLRVLMAGARREEIEAAQAEIDRLTSRELYMQDQMSRLNVESPIAGIIATQRPEEKLGQYVKVGDLIVEVLELRTVNAEIAVSEKEISDVQVGQRVALRTRAMPWKTVQGTIASIAPTVTTPTVTGLRTVMVTTTVDNPTLALKPNMTGVAKIYCGKHSLLTILTRRISHYMRVDFWSWW